MIMITSKQWKLLRLMKRNGEIRAKDGRRVYNTYTGLFNAMKKLKSMGLIDSYEDMIFGCRRYRLTVKGKRIL